MITRVKLENWKSHRKTEIEFGKGTNVLVGHAGSGKSSIVEAITFALFGTVSAVQRRQIKLEDLITNRPDKAERATVEVSFIAPDGCEYTVTRQIERGGGSKAELRKEGKLVVPEGSRKVTEEIQKVLDNIDFELYSRAVYSEQDELDLLLVDKDRKRRIDQILGIDQLEQARKNAVRLVNYLKRVIDSRQRDLENLKNEKPREKLRELNEEVQKIQGQIASTTRELNEYNQRLSAIRDELEKLRSIQQEINQLQQKHGELQAEVRGLMEQQKGWEKRLGNLANIPLEVLKNQKDIIESSLRAIQAKKEMVQGEFQTKNSRLEYLKTERAQLETKLNLLQQSIQEKMEASQRLEGMNVDSVEERLSRLEKDIQDKTQELTRIRTLASDTSKSLKDLSRAEAVCPVCESPLDEKKKASLVDRKKQTLAELEKEEEQTRAQLDLLKKELELLRQSYRNIEQLRMQAEGLEKCRADFEAISERLKQIGPEEGELKNAVQELQQELEKLRDQEQKSLQELQELKRKIDDRMELEKIKLLLVAKQAELIRVNRELAEKKKFFDENRLQLLSQEEIRLNRKLGELQDKQRSLQALLSKDLQLADEYQQKVNKLDRLEREIAHRQELQEFLSKVQSAIVKTQSALREDFVTAVNEYMDAFWSGVYPYGDFTTVALRVEDGNYVFKLRDRNGTWHPIEGVASGAERASACLIIRMAISIALAPRIGWMILDEPTHNLDRSIISEFCALLREKLPEQIKQVILITHREELESAAQACLYRFYRDKAKDMPTQVEPVLPVTALEIRERGL